MELSDLSNLIVEKIEPQYIERTKTPVYFAKGANEFGVDINNKFVAGVTLIPVDDWYEWDPIQDEIDNVGAEGYIVLPPSGIHEGKFYVPTIQNESTDWETGYVDSWEVHIEEY